jgi:hypothetical protein
MENKKKLTVKGNSHIIGTEFSYRKWCIESRLPMSLLQILKINFLNKEQQRQHFFSAGH